MKVGVVFEIDVHRLVCGDVTCIVDVAKLIDDDFARMVMLAFSYNIDTKNLKIVVANSFCF